MLPVIAQQHVKLLIDDHVARQIPVLRPLYRNARRADQERFNRIAERIQAEHRSPPSAGT